MIDLAEMLHHVAFTNVFNEDRKDLICKDVMRAAEGHRLQLTDVENHIPSFELAQEALERLSHFARAAR